MESLLHCLESGQVHKIPPYRVNTDNCGLQPADRRDRLIHVLSQINEARGDDAMAMDSMSSDESEEEVSLDYLLYSFVYRISE